MASTKQTLFTILALFFIATAIYHIAGLFYPVNDSPVWRHLLFVFINIFCAYGMIKRPAYFVYIFGLMLAQQLYSHGGSLLNTWQTEHRINPIDMAVVIAMPLIFTLLVADRVQAQGT